MRQETKKKIACPGSWYKVFSSKNAFLEDMFQMSAIVLVSVINHYIKGLHLFWDTLYKKQNEADQQELINHSSVWTQDVVKEIDRKLWMIGTNGERVSGKSVRAAKRDGDGVSETPVKWCDQNRRRKLQHKNLCCHEGSLWREKSKGMFFEIKSLVCIITSYLVLLVTGLSQRVT